MINKVDLYKEIAAKTGFAWTNVKEVMDVMSDIVVEHLKNLEEVKIFEGVSIAPTFVEEKKQYVPLLKEERIIPAHINVKGKFTYTFKKKLTE